ncbi:hypothetical protein IWQ62_004751 [Dispira parvispora]|uniref:VLRF1 domain-containing protein n=1 Tax=Dispira parvispora TaxID=1520584 RepID=A0A9W8E5B8_9FUNG|nr:hypothetical protein IWQ62_004751 [Dispira parvispora]
MARKTQLSVFELPARLVSRLSVANFTLQESTVSANVPHLPSSATQGQDALDSTLTCRTCSGLEFCTERQKRAHFKSDLHVFNLKKSIRQSQQGPEQLLSDSLDENSSSGEESGSELREPETGDTVEAETESKLPAKPPSIGAESQESKAQRRRLRAILKTYTDPDQRHNFLGKVVRLGEQLANEPLVWWQDTPGDAVPPLSTSTTKTASALSLPVYYGVYRAIVCPPHHQHSSWSVSSEDSSASSLQVLRDLQRPVTLGHWPYRLWTILMISGGRFAGAVFDNATGKMVVHKTIQRYTTRRKQGGAQSKNDKAKGPANSAGASLRRYNQRALEEDVGHIIEQWQTHIRESSHIFVAIPRAERKAFLKDSALFGPEGSSSRLRNIPFATGRPTQEALEHCYARLTTVQEVHSAETASLGMLQSLAIESPTPTTRNVTLAKSPTIKGQAAFGLTAQQSAQLLRFVKKDQYDKFLVFIRKANININAPLTDQPFATLLHAAAKLGLSIWVTRILEEGGDPTQVLAEPGGSPPYQPFDLCTNDAARLAFSEFRTRRPTQWDWESTRIPITSPKQLKVQREIRQSNVQPAVTRSVDVGRQPVQMKAPPLSTAAVSASTKTADMPRPVQPPPLPQWTTPAPPLPKVTVLPKPKITTPPPPAPCDTSSESAPSTVSSLLQKVAHSIGWGVPQPLSPSMFDQVGTSSVGSDTKQGENNSPKLSDRELRARAAELRHQQSKSSST